MKVLNSGDDDAASNSAAGGDILVAHGTAGCLPVASPAPSLLPNGPEGRAK